MIISNYVLINLICVPLCRLAICVMLSGFFVLAYILIIFCFSSIPMFKLWCQFL